MRVVAKGMNSASRVPINTWRREKCLGTICCGKLLMGRCVIQWHLHQMMTSGILPEGTSKSVPPRYIYQRVLLRCHCIKVELLLQTFSFTMVGYASTCFEGRQQNTSGEIG